MQTVTFEQAHDILEQACYLEPSINGGDKTIHFGINDQGSEFVLILSAITGIGRLSTL